MKGFHFETVNYLRSLCLAVIFIGCASAVTPQIATQFDFSSDTMPGARKFYFETIPGHCYTLLRSTDLTNWAPVSGYPQVANSLSIEHTFAQGTKEFFRVQHFDDQAPTVEAQYPAVNGFAVGRFADLSVELSDASGIDPSSIRLTVGPVGPLVPGAAGLTISGNTITYDSGDAALGPWGATLSATLVAADTLGHIFTHTWSFRLEPQPQTAANIFVFGSPTAQRAGQRVSGPAAALASRYPAPTGPKKANDPPPWHIDSVLADRIVITYESGGVPAFVVGQLICNLAPTKESEIFYRRVISTSNDAANLKLTVMTTDAALTDFASSGSATVSENSVVYELDGSGTLVRALAVTGTLDFPRIGYDLSGSEFKLKTDGYEAKVNGITTSSGSGMSVLKVTATDYSWWFKPRVRAGIELDWSGLKSFEAIASGQVSSSTVLDGEVLLAGVSVKRTLYDLPEASEPKTVVYLGNIGVVPVYATLGFDFLVKSKTDAKALLNFSVTYRQEASASFGISYQRGSPMDWISAFQATSPDFGGNLGLTGEFSYELSLEPKIEFLVYGLAGISAGIEPKAEVTASVSTNGGLGGKLEGSLDFVLAAAGPAFDLLNIEKELSYSIWEGEWPFIPQALVFKTQPVSKTVVPGGDVSFTCTVDSPSAPTFQWYQNGRLMPGQTSRSLFLPHVSAGHAGTYYVSAKAGNSVASSNSATLTVQSTTPENKDTDGDGIPDIYETNTGVWGSATNTGTNPYKWDSDGDGLSDGVESRTLTYVSRSNTGTDPNKYDTDGDGINDKHEIDLGSDPNSAPIPDGFAIIPAGSFQMGDQSNPAVGFSSELPKHNVYVSKFYIGKYEVTNELWDTVRAWGLSNGYTDITAGNAYLNPKGPNYPVHSISWYDMVKWCNARSQKENLAPCYTASGVVYKTGNITPICNFNVTGYRLPSESEWEKAARGGLSGQNFPWGNTITHNQANYRSSSSFSYDVSITRGYHPTYSSTGGIYTSPVGSFASNGYDLYDMTGNMFEWCWDWEGVYSAGSQTDPQGPTSGSARIGRGGSYFDDASNCRVAYRAGVDPSGKYVDIGFRVVRSSIP